MTASSSTPPDTRTEGERAWDEAEAWAAQTEAAAWAAQTEAAAWAAQTEAAVLTTAVVALSAELEDADRARAGLAPTSPKRPRAPRKPRAAVPPTLAAGVAPGSLPPPPAPPNALPPEAPRPRPPGARPAYNMTDSGNAERFAAQHRGRARFVPDWAMWLVYDGRRWARDPAGVLVGALAKQTVRSIYAEAGKMLDPEVRAALVKWGHASEAKRPREAMVSLARSEAGMAAAYTSLDADPAVLNVANGTLDLRTGQLRPHCPDDLLTKLSPVVYDPAARAPRFEQFLSEIMAGDAGSVEFLRRFLGYCLTGSVREHTMCFWHGETGGNGKSTLTGTMFDVLGEYALKAAPDLLFRSEKGERHPTELADLHGARMVVCNETQRDRTWDESTVKDITGGDPIKARRMRENFWSFLPTHKIIVFGNNKPTIADTNDGGMRRRLRLVPFEVTFTGKPDRALDVKLRAEGPGILTFLVLGCLAWQRDGLTDPDKVADATQGYFAEQDVIGRFVAERCDLNPLAKMPRKDLRAALAAWAEESGDERPSPKDVAKWLAKRGVTDCDVRDAGGRRVNGWRGIRLQSDRTMSVHAAHDDAEREAIQADA